LRNLRPANIVLDLSGFHTLVTRLAIFLRYGVAERRSQRRKTTWLLKGGVNTCSSLANPRLLPSHPLSYCVCAMQSHHPALQPGHAEDRSMRTLQTLLSRCGADLVRRFAFSSPYVCQQRLLSTSLYLKEHCKARQAVRSEDFPVAQVLA
jgi:hypothetical protein